MHAAAVTPGAGKRAECGSRRTRNGAIVSPDVAPEAVPRVPVGNAGVVDDGVARAAREVPVLWHAVRGVLLAVVVGDDGVRAVEHKRLVV